MNIFECEVCGSQEPTDHEELVNHILNEHSPEYSESDAEYYSNLWEQDRLDAQEAEIYNWEEDQSDRDPL